MVKASVEEIVFGRRHPPLGRIKSHLIPVCVSLHCTHLSSLIARPASLCLFLFTIDSAASETVLYFQQKANVDVEPKMSLVERMKILKEKEEQWKSKGKGAANDSIQFTVAGRMAKRGVFTQRIKHLKLTVFLNKAPSFTRPSRQSDTDM